MGETPVLMENFYDSVLTQFDMRDILMTISCMLTSKKCIFISNNSYDAQKTMFTMRDTILKFAGFDWPHLFSTCFCLKTSEVVDHDDEFSGIDNDQLLHQVLPAMLATTDLILAE